MIFSGYELRAAAVVCLIVCSRDISLANCSPTHPSSSSSGDAGASSSWSPFYFYSRTLTGGWTIHLRAESDITNYVPTGPSASALEPFYQAVYDKAISNAMNSEPPSSLNLRLGALSLTLSAESVPLPWHILALFAQNMLNAARRGYVAGYSVTILPPGVNSVNSLDAVEISVAAGLNLNLLSLLAAGREVGEWREPAAVNSSASEIGSGSGNEPPCKRHCSSPKRP